MNDLLNSLHPSLQSELSRPIFFVTPDPYQALGLIDLLPNFHLITAHNTPLVRQLRSKNYPVFCLEAHHPEQDFPKNTDSILAYPSVESYIRDHSKQSQPIIIYFKPSPKLDKICEANGYLKCANGASLNREFEDKVAFYKNYYKFPGFNFPPGFITKLDLLVEQTSIQNIIVQTGRGWAGSSSYLVKDYAELVELMQMIPNREVKITTFIPGKTYTLNACVLPEGKVYCTAPGVQFLSPSSEFAVNPLATCGRAWPSNLDNSQSERCVNLTKFVGQVLHQSGYVGFFGVDLLFSDEDQQIYLLEVNPRLTASESMFTRVEMLQKQIPLMLYHLVSFISPELANLLPEYHQYPITFTQIIMRNTLPQPTIPNPSVPTPDISSLPDAEYLIYPASGNVSPNGELLRLESLKMLVNSDGKLDDMIIEQLVKIKRQITA